MALAICYQRQRRMCLRGYPQRLRDASRGGRIIGGGTIRGPHGRHRRQISMPVGSTNASPKTRAINTKNSATVNLLYPYLASA